MYPKTHSKLAHWVLDCTLAFNGERILKLIKRHGKSACIGPRTFKYAELRNASEFTSMAASTTSSDGTSLLNYLKKHVVGQADCTSSKLLTTIRQQVTGTKQAVPFGPKGSAVDCFLHSVDEKGQVYVVGKVAFTHVAPSDELESIGWLSTNKLIESPRKRWSWALLSEDNAIIFRKKHKIGGPGEWTSIGGSRGADRCSTVCLLAVPPEN